MELIGYLIALIVLILIFAAIENAQKKKSQLKYKMIKIGDQISVSDKNPNHLGYGISAYAGYEGIIDHLFEDGGFVIKGETSELIVPLKNKEKYHVALNGEQGFINHNNLFVTKVK